MSNYDNWKARNRAEEDEERIDEDGDTEHRNPLAGVEELRKIADITKYTRESTWFNYSAEEILNIVRAIRACDWDIFADQLDINERRYAAEHAKLSDATIARLKEHYG